MQMDVGERLSGMVQIISGKKKIFKHVLALMGKKCREGSLGDLGRKR